MKKIEIHPLSALAGAGVAVLGMLALGAQSPGAVVPTHLEVPKVVEHVVKVKGVPAPEEDFVSIRGDVPWFVPEGKRFLVTAIGSTGSLFTSQVVFFDHQPVWRHELDVVGMTIPPGLVAEAGVEIENSFVDGVLLGYLVDA